ncbi:WhiB family transcriptional regulator [Spongiactinospora gelatinilytica]|nr:WhiB family transcriptional regulator [Spongiactinospora gelatinilytica]
MSTVVRATAAPYPQGGAPACSGHDPELWFPPHDDRFARRICAECPLAGPCREHALAYDLYGVWGGMARADREAYWLERGIRPLPVLAHKDPTRSHRLRRRPVATADHEPPPTEAVAEAAGKRCPRCRTVRALTDYYPNAANPDGLAVWCRPCFREIAERDTSRP